MDLFSCDGVAESQKLGMQTISTIAGQPRVRFKWPASCAIQRIANQRMANGRQMDSDLMRAAGTEAHLKCRSACGT
jgi:hypothetical protein